MIAVTYRQYVASLGFAAALLAAPAFADDGSWTTGSTTTKESLFAATTNDSGALLGEYCQIREGSCIWELGIPNTCDKGDSYPILANTDTGAEEMQLICMGKMPNNLFGYAFSKFDAADLVMKSAGRVGFAFPMKEGEFKVVRFLLSGSKTAVAEMRSAAEKAQTRKVSTRDQVI
jgi:hypothetical protein